MPVYGFSTARSDRPGVDFVWSRPRNQGSALDVFALAGVGNNNRRRRPLRVIRTPGVNQAYGSQMYGPFGKSGSVEVGHAADALAEVVAKSDGTISETERKIALATNAAGVAAAPGLIWMATRSAKNNEGSWPRAVGRAINRKVTQQQQATKRSKAPKTLKAKAVDNPVTRGLGRTAENLDKPMSRAAKVGSLAAAGGLVGLQLGNVLGDAIAARAMANAKKDG